MNPKTKKILFIGAFALDVLITVFLFVISIIMIATMPDTSVIGIKDYYKLHPGMITYLQANPTVYLVACVVPLVLLLAANIVFLVIYVKKAGERKVGLADLNEDQKAALREAILKDMESPKEEKKE